MKRDKTTAVRIWARVQPENLEEIKAMSKKLAIEPGKYLSMCIVTGHKALVRSIFPEDALTAEQLVRIAQVIQEDKDKEK